MSWAHLPGRVAIVFFLAFTGSALAQLDAGRLLEDSRIGQPQQPPRPAPRLDLREPVRPALSAPDSFRVLVKGFRITRASVFAEDRLKPLLAPYLGRELGLAELEEAAAAITRYYRERGYFVARAYVPAQEIKDGIVEITVLEGRLGALQIFVAPGSRAGSSPQTVREILIARQPPGSVIGKGLERGLLLLNDTPGLSARATLAPGTEPGTSDLSVDVADTALVTGSVDADNYGNRFSGAARVGATAYFNSPTGSGDLGSVRAQFSSGSANTRFGYQVPVGSDGLRVGAVYSVLRYRLGGEFKGLDASGDANDFTATGQYPWVRSRDINLSVATSLSGKHFVNRTAAGGNSSNKTTISTVIGVSGDSRDDRLGGGLNGFSVSLTLGRLDLSGAAADLASDALTAQANGGYQKTNLSVSRLQRLRPQTNLYVSLAAQRASKNLDSSEQFALGGPTGVRAYPTGEAIGDEGALLSLELRQRFAENWENWEVQAFYDRGQIHLHKTEWPGWEGANPAIKNSYSLSGAGLGLSYSRPGNLTVRGFLALKSGGNPGQNAGGNDSDNRNSRSRVWIQAIKYL